MLWGAFLASCCRQISTFGAFGASRQTTQALRFCQLGFQAGDPLVEEPVVVASAGEPLLESAVVLGELAELCPERVVFGEDPLDPVGGQVVLEVTDAPEQFSDLVSLCGDLAACALEFVLGVKCPLPPAR